MLTRLCSLIVYYFFQNLFIFCSTIFSSFNKITYNILSGCFYKATMLFVSRVLKYINFVCLTSYFIKHFVLDGHQLVFLFFYCKRILFCGFFQFFFNLLDFAAIIYRNLLQSQIIINTLISRGQTYSLITSIKNYVYITKIVYNNLAN